MGMGVQRSRTNYGTYLDTGTGVVWSVDDFTGLGYQMAFSSIFSMNVALPNSKSPIALFSPQSFLPIGAIRASDQRSRWVFVPECWKAPARDYHALAYP